VGHHIYSVGLRPEHDSREQWTIGDDAGDCGAAESCSESGLA